MADDGTGSGHEPRRYTETDDAVWRALHTRQSDLVRRHACREYLDGFKRLAIPADRVADLDAVNDHVRRWSDWRFTPVGAFLAPRTFFRSLHARQFPVRTTMRRPDELEFAALPDLFHDLFGHGPHLFSPVLGPIIEAFARIAMTDLDNDVLLTQLAKLFWITFEVGLVGDAAERKVLGAAIVSSRGELANVFERQARTQPLAGCDLGSLDCEPRRLQDHYFVIDSYDDILAALDRIAALPPAGPAALAH